MNTTSSEAIEFRCTSCWQSNFAPVSAAETEVACQFCQASITVPEATPERIRSMEQVEAVSQTPEPEVNPYSPEMSDAELMKRVQAENHVELADRNFEGFADASLVSRFCASFLDGLLLVAAFALGFVAILGATNLGLINEADLESGVGGLTALGLLYFPALIACVVQWNMIATRGQTIGKFICCIRIVCMNGRLPGFVLGVVVRNWVRVLLSFIPFFALIDILFIFAGNRCLHDYMAGTRVVQS